jgi:flagellar M-ring protein FliF
VSNVPSPAAPGAPAPPAGAAKTAASSTTPAAGAATAFAAGAEQSSSKSDSTTYAISKSLHRSVEPAGRVRRIAAAVLVDDALDVADAAGKRTTTRRKRTVDEMKEIERLARAAIGVDAQRGDVLAVENLSFQELPIETPAPPTKSEHWRQLLEPWLWIFRYVALAALFAVVYFLILRPVKKHALAAFRELPGKVAQKNAAQGLPGNGAAGSIEPPQAEGQRATQLKRMLTDKVKAEPAAASRLVESWVREDKE